MGNTKVIIANGKIITDIVGTNIVFRIMDKMFISNELDLFLPFLTSVSLQEGLP